MQNRRKFLQAMVSTSAGGLVMGHIPVSLAQPARRQVSIGGNPVTIIDMHAHCEIKAVEQVVSGTPLEMTVREARVLGPHRLEKNG